VNKKRAGGLVLLLLAALWLAWNFYFVYRDYLGLP